jgi:HD-GYP domain-containing protein (c-di-GMP phosphodiesterase class II)
MQDMVDIATDRVNFLLKLAAIKAANDYPYNHAANTCVLSIVLGKALEVDRVSLVDLGVSALLADLGFALSPSELVHKPGELTPAERDLLLDELLRSIRTLVGKGQLGESAMRRVVVAYEHHLPFRDPVTARPTGTHLFSRIVAVADAFDALTTRRPWREGYTADEALRILMREAGTRYDPLVVKVLINLLGLYPLGSAVLLGSGELAVVYHNGTEASAFERPWVKVVRAADGERIRRTLIRDLAATEGPGGTIARFATAAEVGDLDPGMTIVG